MEYYIVIDNEQKGPVGMESLLTYGVTQDTLVWREGLPEWRRAGDLEELRGLWMSSNPASDPYFMMKNGMRVGPMSAEELVNNGMTSETPVWRMGMADWQPAFTQPELVEALRQRARATVWAPNSHQPGYGEHNAYQRPADPYSPPPAPAQHVNWLPWAIAGLIVGFLFSCIGLIFGIIAVINANKANNAYALGNEMEGDTANSTAKVMTIIALVIGGIGLLTAMMGMMGLVTLPFLSAF